MNGWSLYKGDDDNWNKKVSKLKESTYLHDNEWAENLEGLAWTVCRWHYQKNGESIAFLQGFLKRYPFGVGILWFPDWIAGDYELGGKIVSTLKDSLSIRFITIRMRSHHKKNNQELAILKQNFYCASNPFGSNMTMHLDLSVSINELQQGLSKNWRRNLKRSNKIDYKIVEVKDANIVSRIYSEMSKVKKMKEFFSEQQIKSLMHSHGDKLIVLGAKTPDGVVQAIRGAIVREDQAIDTFAASNAFSRKHYLTYKLCWDLVNHCKALGCNLYDLNGIDPENNTGVYNFKKGVGGKPIVTLGEFEYSNSFIMKKLLDLVSRLRN